MQIVRTIIACVLSAAFAGPVCAAGRLADVTIFDRVQGRELPIYRHQGRLYVVGTPGNEYEVRIHNRTGGAILGVVSVDGVNAISGETADWAQAGYVLGPGARHHVSGWRKSLERIAAFFFTRHENAYATRTGRPDHTGIIGVALFRQKAVSATWIEDGAAKRQSSGEPGPGSGAPASAHDELDARKSAAPETRLGTGHGRSRYAPVTYTTFERATVEPEEVVAIYYDTYRNLATMGVIQRPHLADPFPGRFVPDPRY